jgi:hypothetical protein
VPDPYARASARLTPFVLASTAALSAGWALGCAGAAADPGSPAAPAVDPPALVDWSCPRGWDGARVPAEGAATPLVCRPPAYAATCPDGRMPAIGTTDCAWIGDACPAGDFPTGLPEGERVVYVRAGAGGDGRAPTSPIGSISQAIELAAEGAVVAIAKGEYVENVSVTKRLTLWGACARDVIVRGTERGEGVLAVGRGGDATVRNLTVRGDHRGVFVGPGGGLNAIGIRVVDARGYGILVRGGSASVAQALVADTRADADGTRGRGVQSDSAGRLTLTGAYVARSREGGAIAFDPRTDLALVDVVVADTLETSPGASNGDGLLAMDGARITGARVWIARSRGGGAVAQGAGSSIALVDAVVADAVDRDCGEGGCTGGVSAQLGSRVELTRTIVENNRAWGVLGSGAKSVVTMNDVVIARTRGGWGNAGGGWGLALVEGAELRADRAIVSGNRTAGLLADGAGTTFTARDLVVAGTMPQATDAKYGMGVVVQFGARATMDRAWVAENHEAGLVVTHQGAQLEGAHLSVRSTRPRADNQEYGVGVFIANGARTTLAHAMVDGSHVAGLVLQKAATLTATDLTVTRTSPGDFTLLGPDGETPNGARYTGIADGVLATEQSTLALVRAQLQDHGRAGILVVDSLATLRDVRSTANRFGLVVQGSSAVDSDPATCVFAPNREQDRVESGSLAVPNAPIQVPRP